MEFRDVLIGAAKTAEDRNKEYGTVDECFTRIARIASAFFNEEIDEYKIAMILLFVKLGRIGDNKQYEDNYIDGVNYLAFASQFAGGSAKKQPTPNAPSFRIPTNHSVDQLAAAAREQDYDFSKYPSNGSRDFELRGARGA
jgi:hypothetical protein